MARRKQLESFRPVGALRRLLPAISVLCLDRHPCAVGGRPAVCLWAPPVGPPPLAAGRCSPADLPLPITLAPRLRIHPVALASFWRVLTRSLRTLCCALILRDTQMSSHKCNECGTGQTYQEKMALLCSSTVFWPNCLPEPLMVLWQVE